MTKATVCEVRDRACLQPTRETQPRATLFTCPRCDCAVCFACSVKVSIPGYTTWVCHACADDLGRADLVERHLLHLKGAEVTVERGVPTSAPAKSNPAPQGEPKPARPRPAPRRLLERLGYAHK